MKTTYTTTVPKEWLLAKPVKLTVSLSKFHIEEYVSAWEVIQLGGLIKDEHAGAHVEACALKVGDLFQVEDKGRCTEVLPGQWLIPYWNVLCGLTGTVVEE